MGPYASPWTVAVNAPTTVKGGASFTVGATVTYRGPHSMEARGQVSRSQAALTMSNAGFRITSPIIALTKITESGTVQTVSWTVTAPTGFSGSVRAKDTAKGSRSGVSTSYPAYTDWIGGSGSEALTVGEQATNVAPTEVSVTPSVLSSRIGEVKTLKAVYADGNGVANLRSVYVRTNATNVGVKGLYAYYSNATDTF